MAPGVKDHIRRPLQTSDSSETIGVAWADPEHFHRGQRRASDMARGASQGVWRTEVPQRGPRAEPLVGVWGRS